MKKLILSLLVFTFLVSGCGEQKEETVSNKKVEDENLTLVKTISLKATEFTDFVSVVGTVKPLEKADLSNTDGGKIIKFKFDKGELVSKGDTIAVIDNDILKANMEAALANYNLAKINYEKQAMLWKDKVNSEFQYLQAKYNMESSKANYELIKARYDKTFILAPFDGIIDQKFIEEGELALPGSPIVRVITYGKNKVVAGVPERYSKDVKIGNEVKIYISSIDKTIDGKVSYVGSSINPDNRTFPIEITITDSDNSIKPELLAEIKIIKNKLENVIIIPEEVLSRVDKGYAVFVADGNKAVMKYVELLKRFKDKAAVKSGLKDGDNLIVVGYQNLVHGEKVKIVN